MNNCYKCNSIELQTSPKIKMNDKFIKEIKKGDKMKLLLFYPTHFCVGMKPIGISTLKSYLQKYGYEVRIFDFAKYVVGDELNNSIITTKINIFKKVQESEKHKLTQKRIAKEELMAIILEEIDRFKPDLLGVSILTNNLALANEYFSYIKAQTNLPIIVGGIHPTVAPDQVICLPWVDMICMSYGEKPLLRLLDSKLADYSIPNIWFKKNGGIIRNAIGQDDVSPEESEFPNWDDFSDVQFYKPFQGKVMRYGDVEFGRGCPNACTFCVVSYLRNYIGKKRCLKKSNWRMINELVYLKNKYEIDIFRFWDELFLLVSDVQFAEFGTLYKKYVDLPFIIETTAESITARKIEILKDIGCVSISIGIESGNVELRNNVLNKRTTNQTYIEKFRMINEAGINTTSYNMIGLPGETEEMILETILLNRRCNVRTPSLGLFYPYPGTQLRDYCIKMGYLSSDFDDYCEESILYTHSVLKQDHIIKPERLKHYLQYFSVYCKVPPIELENHQT